LVLEGATRLGTSYGVSILEQAQGNQQKKS